MVARAVEGPEEPAERSAEAADPLEEAVASLFGFRRLVEARSRYLGRRTS